MSFLLCLAKLRRNLVLCKTPQETLLNTSVFGSSVEWKRTCSAFFTSRRQVFPDQSMALNSAVSQVCEFACCGKMSCNPAAVFQSSMLEPALLQVVSEGCVYGGSSCLYKLKFCYSQTLETC